MFSMAAPSFAALPNTMDDARKAAYRAELTQIVYNSLSGMTGLIPEDTIKELVLDFINDYLDPEALLGVGGGLAELAGPALGELITGMLADAGITLPDSININEIIGEVLTNEDVTNVITSILTNEFVVEVINRTINKVIASFSISDLADPVLWSVADKIAEELWNNGNPSTGSFLGAQLGIWNNSTEKWIPGGLLGINVQVYAKLGLSAAGIGNAKIEDYLSLDGIDFTSMLDMEVLLQAFLDSLEEVAKEYAQTYIGQFRADVRAAVINELNKLFCVEIPQNATNDEIRDILRANARTAIINELSKFFCVEIPQNATNDEIKGIIEFRLLELECQHADKVVKKLEFLKKIAAFFCCDTCDCIDDLINCISTKCVVKPILNSEPKMAAYKISTTSGNMAKITVTVAADYIMNIYNDVETQTFTGEYNGAYTVGETINIQAGEFVVSVTMKKAPATYNVNSFVISY